MSRLVPSLYELDNAANMLLGLGSDAPSLFELLGSATLVVSIDTGTGVESWSISVTTSGTDSGTGSDAASLLAALTGSDGASGGDTGTATRAEERSDLDISFSVDEETGRAVEFFDSATGVEGAEAIAYLVRLLSDTDSATGYDLHVLQLRKQGTLLSTSTSGINAEGSIGDPQPGV